MTKLLHNPEPLSEGIVSAAVRSLSRIRKANALPSMTCLQRSRLVVLTHYLPPYMARVLQHITSAVPHTQVLLSIPQEPNRNYALDWGNLDVVVQKSLMLRRAWKHRAGFQDELYVHMPYDTYSRLRRVKPDLIFSYELGFRSLASALYRKLHPQTRLAYCVCVSEHTESGRGSARWLLRKALVRMADAVTYNGPSCREYLRQLSVPEEKLYHFPYAADDRTDPPLRTVDAAANRRLLIIGQLTQRKGVLPALDSLSEYCRAHPDQAWDLTLIGSGPLESSIRSRSTPANLRLNVLGHLDPSELSSRWHEFGVLLFPTLADEWGLVVNEAMRAGLPVIGSRFAQASNTLIKPGQNGWLYTPDQPQDLFACLEQLHSLDAAQLEVMRATARQTVAPITSQAVGQAACQMFERLLGA